MTQISGTHTTNAAPAAAGVSNGALSRSAGSCPFAERVRRVRHLIRKEFIQIVRQRQNFRILIIAPLMQLVIFGYASRLDVKDAPTVVVDLDRSALSRTLIDAFSRSGYFTIVARLNRYDEADDYLMRGTASTAILIPPDLERLVNGNRTAQIGVLIDGVDTTTAGTVSGYALSIAQRVSTEIQVERMNRMQGLLFATNTPRLIVSDVKEASRSWFNANLDSKYFFVPGVIVLIFFAQAIVLTSAVIVREKEIGTIEQLMVAPISRLELIVGKTIPCFLIALFTVSVVTPLGLLMYDVPFRGSLAFFYATSILFIITACSIGITISTFCTTQQQAMLTSFMFLQPSVLLSGYIFPIENMPTWIQYLTYLNPLRYYITIVRGVFLKGTGWEVLWPQIIPIVVLGIVFMGLASVLFKRRMD